MESFLFRENSWTHAKHNGGKDDCFGAKLKECNSIVDVLRMYWTISCSSDFNEFIHRALDSSLKGNSRKRPFRSIRTFQASTKLEENIFPFNFNSNESQLYCNHNNKSSILICFSGEASFASNIRYKSWDPFISISRKILTTFWFHRIYPGERLWRSISTY